MVEPEKLLSLSDKASFHSPQVSSLLLNTIRDRAIQSVSQGDKKAVTSYDLNRKRENVIKLKERTFDISVPSAPFSKEMKKQLKKKNNDESEADDDDSESEGFNLSAKRSEERTPLAIWQSSSHGFRYRANGDERFPWIDLLRQDGMESRSSDSEFSLTPWSSTTSSSKRHLVEAAMIHYRDSKGNYLYNKHLRDFFWTVPKIPRFGPDADDAASDVFWSTRQENYSKLDKLNPKRFYVKQNGQFYEAVLKNVSKLHSLSAPPSLPLTRKISDPFLQGTSSRVKSHLGLNRSAQSFQSLGESLLPKHSFHKRFSVPLHTMAKRKFMLDHCKISEKEKESLISMKIRKYVKDIKDETDRKKYKKIQSEKKKQPAYGIEYDV